MAWTKRGYTDLNKEKPPIGEWITVRVSKKSVWMTPYDHFNFALEEYRAKLVITGQALLLWEFKHIDGYKFPLAAVSCWINEKFEPIENRFEILDL